MLATRYTRQPMILTAHSLFTAHGIICVLVAFSAPQAKYIFAIFTVRESTLNLSLIALSSAIHCVLMSHRHRA